MIEDKILVVKPEMGQTAWNNSLPVPLRPLEKVVVVDNQKGVAENYVRVRHGKGDSKRESIFSIMHFTTLTKKKVIWHKTK